MAFSYAAASRFTMSRERMSTHAGSADAANPPRAWTNFDGVHASRIRITGAGRKSVRRPRRRCRDGGRVPREQAPRFGARGRTPPDGRVGPVGAVARETHVRRMLGPIPHEYDRRLVRQRGG